MFKPTVGPIIGHTTTDHARIFIRGKMKGNAPVFAGLRYRQKGEEAWSPVIFIELTAKQDMCAVFALDDLAAETRYEYQCGWFNAISPSHTTQSLQELPLQWPQQVYQLLTRSSRAAVPRAYIIGSCRYLRMSAGVAVLPHWGDRIFASISHLVQQATPPVSALMMTGDQVYLDDLNAITPDKDLKAILAKYRAAFSQPHIAQVMSGVSTYMILDDHEIEDNWPANKSELDTALYINAMQAYELYQASHSPAHAMLTNGQAIKPLEKYWYKFTDGDIEWFVTDSRTERNLSVPDRHILDQRQEQALFDWLIHSPARVKFVVTSVMFYPDRKRMGDDAWKAFPEQRLRLLETIRTHRLKNVFFISGDVHGSLTSRLTHSEDPEFEVHTIVSSPLCNSWLLPYATTATFILDEPLASTAAGEYRHELTSPVISQDNFAHLIVDTEHVYVNYLDREGKPLQSTSIKLR